MSFKRSIFFTFLTQAPTLLLYFVSSTLLTRLLGDVGRGEYALLTNQVALLAMLVSFNVGFGVTYFTSRAGTAAKNVVGTASTMLCINMVAVPIILLGFATTPRLTDLFMPSTRTDLFYWGFVYLSIVLSLLNTTIAAVLLGLKRFKILNWMGILNAGLSAVAFLVLFVIRDSLGTADILPTVLVVSAIAMSLNTAAWIALYVVEVRIPPIPIWTWSLLRPILAFSLIGHLSNLINLINYRFDIWVIGDILGESQLGIYTVAVGVAQLLFYIPDPFSRVVQPYLFGQLKDEMLDKFKTVARVNFTAVLGLAVLLAITAHWLLPLLFGAVFSASVMPLYLLLPGIVLSSATKLLVPLVVHGGYQRVNLYSISAAAVLTIVLDLLLIPELGIEGAAIATSIAYLVIMLALLWTIRYRMGVSIHDMFFVRPSDIRNLSLLIAGPGSAKRMVRTTIIPGRKKRVLCVVGWWPTGADVTGVFIKEHIQAIAREHAVEVLYVKVVKGRVAWPSTTLTTDMEDGLLVHRATILTPLRRFELAERLVRSYYKRVIPAWHKEDPFDLIHVHVRTEVTEHVLATAKTLDLPVVVTEHNSFYHLGIRQLPPAMEQQQRIAIRQWFKHPNIRMVMPVSKDLARVLHDDFEVPQEKLSVIHNVAADAFKPTTPPADEPFRMMLAAVWRPPKDHDVFIKAIALLPTELARRCVIEWVGYGPDYALIMDRCQKELAHVDVRFPGYQDKQEMAHLMQQSHLFVLPTHADNLPCVVIESLCCGTPVVSMNVNGVPELIDATNGILVPASDPQALADALMECMRSGDRFDRHAIAEAAAPKFSAAAISEKITGIYAQVTTV
ncbi:MAG TPA: glycosyltransferase [Flavobacteriales bacterium]|nr:glycosyltransferase [Flavobacteriales bacterium]MBK6551453.1 glycosyltransferase [Flavobacteriales bacterium]MBK7101845.1 glycosyltransferase [Flavobacteriales bacterium]MBK7114193.1 glycosyltransferase [Flavobacteriales bacterium]MBK7483754.1 glycosyltransferase [Flavobacteriales bacterium]